MANIKGAGSRGAAVNVSVPSSHVGDLLQVTWLHSLFVAALALKTRLSKVCRGLTVHALFC